ncbi:hypothetical protein MMH89_02050 [Candidatus Comchoanobacter bicostacola]|uniref:Uncharacterized protein n=1 Tax=Candidatus Comchoanobacter bicostacola TaxID=2919598 RepID=A0ABY5DKB3_9GAMM|nr:hypothetical protein [Candidatus Comchoanobacter bicostacola]UTC24931.1 hypothetical protein MMH89_02050 [Candidatus Comchoanobacter bicostacola]
MLNELSRKDLERSASNARLFVTDLMGNQWQLSQSGNDYYLDSQGPQEPTRLKLGLEENLSYKQIAQKLAEYNSAHGEKIDQYLEKTMYTQLLKPDKTEEQLQALISSQSVLGAETGRFTSPRNVYHIDFKLNTFEVTMALCAPSAFKEEELKPADTELISIKNLPDGYQATTHSLAEKAKSVQAKKATASETSDAPTQDKQIDIVRLTFSHANNFNPYIKTLEEKINKLDTKQPYDAFRYAYYNKCIAKLIQNVKLPPFAISHDLLLAAAAAPGLSKGKKMRIELMALLYRDKILNQNSFSTDYSASLGEQVKEIMNNVTIAHILDAISPEYQKARAKLPKDIQEKLMEIQKYGFDNQPNFIAQFCNDLYEQFINTALVGQIIIGITLLPLILIGIGRVIHNRENTRSASASDAIANFRATPPSIRSNTLQTTSSKSLESTKQIHPNNAPRPSNDSSEDHNNSRRP